ncbi:MAG: phospholipid carrier-dependent glycosyltransferase, partial [Planctomycetia bacterium]
MAEVPSSSKPRTAGGPAQPPADDREPPSVAPPPPPGGRLRWLMPLVVGLAAFGWFGWNLDREPFFVDESASLSRGWYTYLWRTGRWNHSDWLHPAAYDHGAFEYLTIGGAVELAGYGSPKSVGPWERWMAGDRSGPTDPAVLRVARLPSVLGAALGCAVVAAYVRRLTASHAAGVAAAGLLAFSPLYLMHARRAMTDDALQLFTVAALAAATLWIDRWNRQAPYFGVRTLREVAVAALMIGGGVGLAVTCKLNGAIAGLALGATAAAAGWLLWRRGASRDDAADGRRRWLAAAATLVLAAGVAVAVVVATCPFFLVRT